MYRLKVEETKGIKRGKIPVCFSIVPIKGEVRRDHEWSVTTETGEAATAQSTPREYYDDGSVKLTQISFVCDTLDAWETRGFDCVPQGQPGISGGDASLIHETDRGFEVRGKNLNATVDGQGRVVNLIYRGKQIISEPSFVCSVVVYEGIPSSRVGLTLESASKRRVEGSLEEAVQCVRLIENGPVRGTIETSGQLVEPLHNTRPLEFTRCLTFYREVDEIGVECKLLNGSTARYLKEWKTQLVLQTPEVAVIHGDEARQFSSLVDLNLLWSTLQIGGKFAGVGLGYSDGIWVSVVSQDFGKYRTGMIQLNSVDERMEKSRIAVNRIEPTWHYKGITSHHPIDHLLFLEGQRRSSSLRVLFNDGQTPNQRPEGREDGVFVHPPDDGRGEIALPTANGQGSNGRRWDELKQKVIDRALGFVVDGGEYHGLISGGRCHINGVFIEHGVNRSEYAEYLLYEYKRSGDKRLFDIALEYAERFIDVSIFRSKERMEWSGAVRHRYSENKPDMVRSMRGPIFLIALYLETGRREFKDTALEIGNYILTMFPSTFARQGAVCRELAFLYYFTGDERFRDKAYEVMEAVKSYQLPGGAWYDAVDKEGKPASVNEVIAGVSTSISPVKPEMASYNIIGIIDAAKYMAIDPFIETIEKAATWLLEVQDEEGAWRFPTWSSDPQWGHGVFEDALAMLKAYEFFGKEEFLKSADSAISWAENVWDVTGYIPSVTSRSPYDYLEASLTYFYGIEALSLRSEMS